MYRILVPGDGTGTAGLEGAQAWIDGRRRRRENTNMAKGGRWKDLVLKFIGLG